MDVLPSPSPSASPSKRKAIQDDDIALARLLQEQERAMWMLMNRHNVQAEAAVEASSLGDEGEQEEISDEELARRLQEEEDRAAYAALYGPLPGEVLEGNDGQGEAEEDIALSYEELQHLGDIAGKVSKGLKQGAVQQLPCCAFSELQQQQQEGQAALDKCCVCQCEFEGDDCVTSLPCSHYYHKECIEQWLQDNKVCPICSREVSLEGDSAGADTGDSAEIDAAGVAAQASG